MHTNINPMRTAFISLFLISNAVFCNAQDLLERTFGPLMDKTWIANGEWGNGSVFKQEVTFKQGLDGQLVQAESLGFTDPEQSQFGLRNIGIRRYDPEKKSLVFFEFDVFGGLTTGTIETSGKDILYHYEYGGTMLTDEWKFVDEMTYQYTVGTKENGQWISKYLETKFVAKPDPFVSLQKQLVGKWQAPAWDGYLNESWKVGSDGHLHQEAIYEENGEVLYRSHSKIEKVGEDLILFSVIKDNPPKIFKATDVSNSKIIFENSDYQNPDKVVYLFESGKPFQRVISGTEKGEATSYTFDFRRIEQ